MRMHLCRQRAKLSFFFLPLSPPPRCLIHFSDGHSAPPLQHGRNNSVRQSKLLTCCLPALDAFCRSAQNHTRPGSGPWNCGASRTRERRTGQISAAAQIWSGHTWAHFTHACYALGLTGFKGISRYMSISQTTTTSNVSISCDYSVRCNAI